MGDEYIYPPKKKRKQRLTIVGTRTSGEPALIPCHGVCSKPDVTWTVHNCVQGSSYECTVCKQKRQWGLQFWGSWRD